MRKLIVLVLLLISSSCLSPNDGIREEIEAIRNRQPSPFLRYQTARHGMSLAWTGDPQKQPVLLIHGSPGSWETWAAFLTNPQLQKNFHLLAINRTGYEDSEPGTSETSLATASLDILEVLQFNHSGKAPIVVGYSYGGAIAARIAMDFPNKVAGIVLVSAPVDPNIINPKWYRKLGEAPMIRWLLPTYLQASNRESVALKGELVQMLSLWTEMKAKVVSIHGDNDPIVNSDHQKFIQDRVPAHLLLNSQTISEMNHFVPWKRPEAIIEAIQLLAQ